MGDQQQQTEDDGDSPERSRLRQLLVDNGGNQTKIARVLGIKRQQLERKLKRLDLMDVAEVARNNSATPGQRKYIDPNAPELAAHRQRIIDAVARAGGYRSAAKLLDVGESTVARSMSRYKITREEIAARRAEIERAV